MKTLIVSLAALAAVSAAALAAGGDDLRSSDTYFGKFSAKHKMESYATDSNAFAVVKAGKKKLTDFRAHEHARRRRPGRRSPPVSRNFNDVMRQCGREIPSRPHPSPPLPLQGKNHVLRHLRQPPRTAQKFPHHCLPVLADACQMMMRAGRLPSFRAWTITCSRTSASAVAASVRHPQWPLRNFPYQI